MLDRVRNPHHERAGRYVERGIRVCDRWLLYENFLADMGRRPSPRHSIDRIDNDGDYEPGNCRWATDTEQRENQERTRRATIDGVTKPITEWARELGVSIGLVRYRLYAMRWTPEEALTTPKRTGRYPRVSGGRIRPVRAPS